jgi:Tol biopolymer transport system component/DNA-binding winged helix-turn-helix (wHTH) protein
VLLPPSLPQSKIRFGDFSLDPHSGELRKNGSRIRLQVQPFRVLQILLQHAGDVVTREELQKRIWPADTFVDFDQGLNNAVNKLRDALGDKAERPRFVETLAKRGYRFIAPVEPVLTQELSDASATLGVQAAHEAVEGGVASESRLAETCTPRTSAARNTTLQPQRSHWWPVLVALMILAVVSVRIFTVARRTSKSAVSVVDEIPLTGQSSLELAPAFSPDGNEVAFSRHSESGQDSGLFVASTNTEKLLQLTKDRGDCYPVWSPDGQQIAFSRTSDDKFEIYIIPRLGGTERQLYVSDQSADTALSWSPDGKMLAFSEWDGERARIVGISVSDKILHALSSPPKGHIDRAPAFSPDGRTLAFVRMSGMVRGLAGDLFVAPVSGNEARQITYDDRWIFGSPAWTSDGRELVFSSNRGGGLITLWRISSSGGEAVPLSGVGPTAIQPSISLRNDRLAYVHAVANENLWLVRLRGHTEVSAPPSVLISSKSSNGLPQFSPDGKQIAFESERSGHGEIWVADSDGSNVRAVTSMGAFAGSPHWSPDGTRLTFDFSDKGHVAIYVVDVPNGLPRLVNTFPDSDNIIPSWSRDGRWIYFSSNQGGQIFRLWKVPVSGGVPLLITKNSGAAAVESDDGFLYYSRMEGPVAAWRVPLSGGEEKLVLDMPTADSYNKWALAGHGIYFMDRKGGSEWQMGYWNFGRLDDRNARSGWQMRYFDFHTGRITLLRTMDKPPFGGLAVSPDGKSLIYSQDDQAEFSIITVKNFD